jgi:hypothetical protein
VQEQTDLMGGDGEQKNEEVAAAASLSPYYCFVSIISSLFYY